MQCVRRVGSVDPSSTAEQPYHSAMSNDPDRCIIVIGIYVSKSRIYDIGPGSLCDGPTVRLRYNIAIFQTFCAKALFQT